MTGDSTRLADYASVTKYLYALKAGGLKFGIDRMRRLAEELGHPERNYPVIHIAGTNGKGSVAAMLESIFRAAGRRTGLYTSPHLVKLGERVQVDRHLLTEADLVAYTAELKPVADRIGAEAPDEHPTFFEFMTAMAFLQFQRQAVDIALVEVGMGGRLDATNIVEPEVSVITSIGLDHCLELGDTFEKIAREKGGIIKQARPVVLGRLPPEAEETIRKIASDRGAPVISVREQFGERLEDYPLTNLEGDCQRWNAATATLVARTVPENLRPSQEMISHGLQHVSWPGRWQRKPIAGRKIILDASHNPEGAIMLEQNLQRLIAVEGRTPVIVAGALGEFRAKALLDVIVRYAREIYLVAPHQVRATSFEEMQSLVPANKRHLIRRGNLETIFPDSSHCGIGEPGDTVLVTGSIYLLGEVLERIEPDRGAGEGRLQDF